MQIIEIISEKEAMEIISNRKREGKFLVFEDGCYTAIDNSTHDAWTESFIDLRGCIKYLKGGDLNDVEHKKRALLKELYAHI